MLLEPGTAFEYNGPTHHYPDIRLVYWSGGNPFHHHQDIGKLRQAFARPDLGQSHGPPHPEGMRMLLRSLLDEGVPRDFLALMTKRNPACLAVCPSRVPADDR